MSQARRVGNDVVRRCGRGRGAPGRAVVRDALTAAALARIFALGADVLAIEFEALAGEPGKVLGALARVCGTGSFEGIDAAPVNRAERARFAPLAAAAKGAAWALRAAGARRVLQALKDDPRVVGIVFRRAEADELPVLGEEAAARLDRHEAACRAAVAAAGEPLGDGLWLVRGGADGGGKPALTPYRPA